MLSISPAQARDVQSLQNWIENTGSIPRVEALYLTHSKELMSLGFVGDNAMRQLEEWVEDKFISYWKDYRKACLRTRTYSANRATERTS